VSGLALAIVLAPQATAQTTPSSAEPRPAQQASPAEPAPVVRTGVPAGFEDLNGSVDTLFDLTFQERRIGSFAGRLEDGIFVFEDPEAVAAALGDTVDASAVVQFLSRRLLANEQFRCRPGQLPISGCGLLPQGESGVIVNADNFSVTLFLPRELLRSRTVEVRELGAPMSGPSLIQNLRFSAASVEGNELSYGGTLSTFASVGQTALIAQTTVSSFNGMRSEEAYVQHLWDERRAAAGLLQDFQTLTLNSYRMLGGEFGSFYGTLIDPANDLATPIEVLLPKRAQVEIYRFGVLIASGLYDAGLQLIDTRPLPDGTYEIRVVVRDGGQILLDQVRPFSRMNTALPPGKLGFRVRVGQRVRDSVFSSGFAGQDDGFLPKVTDELILSGALQRRLGRSVLGGVTATSFGSRVFGEATLQVNHGRISTLAGIGGGSGGAYSIVLGGNVQFARISANVSARRMRGRDELIGVPGLTRSDRYQPFFRSQDTVFGSVQGVVLGGSLNLTGSYTRASGLPTRYTAGVQYTRQVRMPMIGNALLTAGLARSDFDTRVGVSVSFFRRVDRKTTGSFALGGQYVTEAGPNGARRGLSPVVDASIARTERWGSTDIIGELGASTDADTDLAIARVRALSNLGTADVAAQWQSRGASGSAWTYQLNGETGFAIGDGAAKVGLRAPADAMVMLDIGRVRHSDGTLADAAPADAGSSRADPGDSRSVADGGYRVMIDGRPADFIEPGSRVAIGVQPLREYIVSLRPEGAPQFDLDTTQRRVVVYPGNVVRVRFEAQRVVSMFGQVVDADGRGLGSARVEAGTDFVTADDRGYFTITAPLSATMTIRTKSGDLCLQRSLASLTDTNQPSLLYRFGQVSCAQPSAATPVPASVRVLPSAAVPAIPANKGQGGEQAPPAASRTSQLRAPTRVVELLEIARADLDHLDWLLASRPIAER
jgi:hypothetical protein